MNIYRLALADRPSGAQLANHSEGRRVCAPYELGYLDGSFGKLFGDANEATHMGRRNYGVTGQSGF